MTDSTTRFRSVLVYDGDCPFCSAAATALRRLDDVGTVPWKDESAQRFLDAQFGETPFALAFVDSGAERVWLGESAAEELCNRAGLPTLVGDIVGDSYESIADAVRRVTGAEGDPDPYHGEFPLSEEATARFADLASNAKQTHRPDVGDGAGAGRSGGLPGRGARIRGSLGRNDGGSPGRSRSNSAGRNRGGSSESESESGNRTTDDVPNKSRRRRGD